MDAFGLDLSRLLRGDDAAWSAFVDRAAPIVYAAVRKSLGGGEGVEDVTQDVFVRLVRDDRALLRRYDAKRSSLATWLTIIARSVAIDALRAARARPSEPLGERAAALAAPPKKAAAAPVIPPGVLTGRQRLVLTLLFDRGLDPSEAAAVLGVEAQTIRSTKHKALERLRARFAETSPRQGVDHERRCSPEG